MDYKYFNHCCNYSTYLLINEICQATPDIYNYTHQKLGISITKQHSITMDIVKGLEKRNIKSIIKNSIIQKTFVTLYQKNKKPIIIYLNLSDKVQELNRFTSVMFIIFILFNLN